MKVEKKTQVTFYLELTEEEAAYLKRLTQNYLGKSEKEPSPDKEIRFNLFHAIEIDPWK